MLSARKHKKRLYKRLLDHDVCYHWYTPNVYYTVTDISTVILPDNGEHPRHSAVFGMWSDVKEDSVVIQQKLRSDWN